MFHCIILGCNPKQKNQKGVLPHQIAKDSGHKALVKELKKAERLHGKLFKDPSSTVEPWTLTLYDWSKENEDKLRKAFELASDEMKNIEVVPCQTFVSVLQDFQAPVNNEQVQKILLAHDKQKGGLINFNEFLKGLKYLPRTLVMACSEPKKKKKRGAKTGKVKKKSKLNFPLPICILPPELVNRREDGGPPNFMIETHQFTTDPNRFDRDHPPRHPIEDDSAWYIDEPEKIYVNISYCVKNGDTESLKRAFRQKVPVDVKDNFFKTPLITACASGNYEMAKFLLDLG